MSKVMITESYLEDIADAIRSKNGSSNTYKPSQMSTAISNLGGATLGTKTITENNTYNASSDNLDGYSSVTVNVPNPSTGTKQISISSNGTTTENVTDYASAEISVSVSPNVGTKSIVANGTYAASSDNLDGFSSITVAVPIHPAFTLIGEKEYTLTEYTDTSTAEETDTGIVVQTTDYLFGLIIVTCDSAITTSTEWGMSVSSFGRYRGANSDKLYWGAACNLQTKGSASISLSANSATMTGNSYGVYFKNNVNNVIMIRKAASQCPKIRAGKYTVKVYGLSAF